MNHKNQRLQAGSNLPDAAQKQAKKAAKLAAQLAMFDSYPDIALVSVDVVCAVLGKSKTSIRRDISAGLLDPPVKIGPNCSRHRVGSIRARAGAK